MPRNWSDTVLTVGPDGTVSADFTGVVHATGLTMDAGTGTPNLVRWLDANGVMVAYLEGSESTARRSSGVWDTKSANGSGDVQFTAAADSDGPSRARVSVSDDVHGNKARTILGSDGQSDFPLSKNLGQTLELQWDGVHFNVYFNGVLVKAL